MLFKNDVVSCSPVGQVIIQFKTIRAITTLHPQIQTSMQNKKVLLRERKRHTARRVVSTPSVVLPVYPPRGGYPVRYPPGGVPGPPPRGTWTPPGVPGPPGGVPSQVPPGGYPDPPSGGSQVPPGGTWSGTPPGGYPDPPRGVPDRVPPPGGYPDPPLPPQVWTDKQSETITFPSYYVRGR